MARFLRPDIDFSDDDDSIDSERRTTAGPRIISNQIKKTQTNINAIKNPDMYSTEEEDGKVTEEDEPEVVISDDESPRKSPRKTQKRKSENSGRTKRKKPKRVENSDDEFLPTDEDSGSNDDEEDNESVASEDLSEDNISDSDFNPDSEEEIDADKEDVLFDESHQASEATINLSSDGESPDKKEATKTFDPNSTEFWDKVQELRSKGFSIQQAGNEETAKSKCSGHMSYSGCTIFLSIINIILILSAAICRVLHSVFCATAETASVHRMLSAVAASIAGSLSVWTRCEQRSVCFGQFCVQCVQLCSTEFCQSAQSAAPFCQNCVLCVRRGGGRCVFRVRCTAGGGQTELCVSGVFLAVCCTEH